MDKHLEQCEECNKVKQGLEPVVWEPETERPGKEVEPLRKVRKHLRKKNRWIAVFVCISLVLFGTTAVLFFGQIAKKGVSFELLYEAVRLRNVGREFAEGSTESLYEILYDGYSDVTEEAGVLRLAYADEETYDTTMKEVLSNRYREWFHDVGLKFCGIEELRYEVITRMGKTPVIYALKTEKEFCISSVCIKR